MERERYDFGNEGKSRRERKQEEMAERFGRGIIKIPGFTEFLSEQTDEIVDVKADTEANIGVCLFDRHWCEGVSSPGMASIVTLYHDNNFVSKEFVYKDPYHKERCDKSLEFRSLEIIETTSEAVKIKATPRDEKYAPSKIILKMP